MLHPFQHVAHCPFHVCLLHRAHCTVCAACWTSAGACFLLRPVMCLVY
jgi:hypothetical protein